ncbi:MAG: 2-oxo acid dehydrogenase subunit E2 [Terricaulis sp.]
MADAIQILMPMEQEGSKSVVRAWLKQVGDAVKRDEPIVELETDKVAVEVPAPADGVLTAITLSEGDDAAPGAVLGLLAVGAAPRAAASASPAMAKAPATLAPADKRTGGEQRLSPLVRRLLADNKLDASAIKGTGRDGRITHEDVESHLRQATARVITGKPGELRSHRVRHDSMRRFIAEHMTRSVQTAPHVTSVFEADFSAIAAHRAKHKAAYKTPLTYSAYFVRAAAVAMQAAPNVNSRWHENELEVFDSVNIGIGVALGDKGLIVPVIREAQALSLADTATRLHDAIERARAGKLTPADTQGGTFTISNHGVSGSLLASPIIINQPQSAILGIGKLEKRVVVREVDGADAMLIRPMAYVTLTIDHRVIDAHQTNAWLTRFVEVLETWPLND